MQQYYTVLLSLCLLFGYAIAQGMENDLSFKIASPITRQSIEAKRAEIIDFIWGSAGFPNGSPDISLIKFPENYRPLKAPGYDFAAATNMFTYLFSLSLDGRFVLKSHLFHLSPKRGRNNRLVIFHLGHDCKFGDSPIDRGTVPSVVSLLSANYDVLFVHMPRLGEFNCVPNNPHPALLTPYSRGSGFRFFFDGIAQTLNYINSAFQFQDISMIGLSGGGWTTLFYSAIDPRITISMPVSGSIPLYYRIAGGGQGDLEQYWGRFYHYIAGYLDLYILAATHPKGYYRKHIQVLIRHDNCCFGEPQWFTMPFGDYYTAIKDWEKRVRWALLLGGLNLNQYQAFVDEKTTSHKIGPDIVERFLAELRNIPRVIAKPTVNTPTPFVAIKNPNKPKPSLMEKPFHGLTKKPLMIEPLFNETLRPRAVSKKKLKKSALPKVFPATLSPRAVSKKKL
jgi:hypothetical protein